MVNRLIILKRRDGVEEVASSTGNIMALEALHFDPKMSVDTSQTQVVLFQRATVNQTAAPDVKRVECQGVATRCVRKRGKIFRIYSMMIFRCQPYADRRAALMQD